MDIDQARTFLAIVANRSFLEAARQLHLTQSTVSARIKRLEEDLGAQLFVRSRAGATLTKAGRRFSVYAKRLVLTANQARDEIGLPDRYHSSIRIGGRIALWEGFLTEWARWMRNTTNDVVLRCEIGFEEDMMRSLIEGSLDVGVMYTPSHSLDLVVEHLFDDNLILVSTRDNDPGPMEDYTYVDWGPGFHARHVQHYTDLDSPRQTANIGWLGVQLALNNGGSCFLPARMVKPMLADVGSKAQQGNVRLHRVAGSPEFEQQVYMVFPRDSDNPVLTQALKGLRLAAKKERRG
ncbi:MAG: transcriptional regulator [marine bacterium B5-7]|nr:MAG: transcriptional regulator [marine bacterium B5-7]